MTDATAPSTSAPASAPVEVGPTPGDREIAFDLVLEVPGRDAMAAYARVVADPASPDYRRFLRADEIGADSGFPTPTSSGSRPGRRRTASS